MNLIKELRKLKKLEQNYRKASMDFVERWAEFVKTHPDKEWSKQHHENPPKASDHALKCVVWSDAFFDRRIFRMPETNSDLKVGVFVSVHNKFIDSELEKMSKNQPTREEYLKMKGEWRGN